ncbi:hypothetical protein CJU90_0700 [Yarrowia sp. C11]|nr:hypothetical protein CKK34_2112 [Yarrowia sp. E02]KAG5373034.1 hypothetical protein CJU90_0700 [Yarrowia sp. C11]
MNASISSASMAETYFLASKARHKLTKEASRPDLHLRQLVSHANLVDLLMDELADRRAKGKVQQHNQNVVSSEQVTQAINNAPQVPSHIMEEDESDYEYEQVSTPNYTYQAYESIEEVDDDEEDDDEIETECASACFYNTTNSSVEDLQTPQLYYSSSSDEEDDLEHHSAESCESQRLHKSQTFHVADISLASESPIIVA